MNDTDEMLILEWCGFKNVGRIVKVEEGVFSANGMEDNEGNRIIADEDGLDLNFYFEYAVPKLLSSCWKLRLSWNCEIENSRPQVHLVYCGREANKQNRPHIQVKDKDPAEAFGQALLKLIKATKAL